MLTLTVVAEDPLVLTQHLSLDDGSEVVFRPLTSADADYLAAFFEGLSAESRRLSTFDGADSARLSLTTIRAGEWGTQVFPLIADVARRFGKKRIILWGGVPTDNPRAIRYYEKQGFRTVGSFTGADGTQALGRSRPGHGGCVDTHEANRVRAKSACT
ncbi:hypothetical protein SUDANB176_00165 [Streptomyces sp. enrichment culture]